MQGSWQKILILAITFPSSLIGTAVFFFGLAKAGHISNGLALLLFVLVGANFIYLLLVYAKKR